MIFVIDDKTKRQQQDFGWTNEKFKSFDQHILPIYTLEDLTTHSTAVFKEGNTVLYHESFLDHTHLAKEALEKRNRLEEFAKKNPGFHLAIFSGSKSSRSLDKNIAHLPASVVYQNLDIFVKKCTSEGANLKYLLFGENPEIEEALAEKLQQALFNIDQEAAVIPDTKNMFISTDINDIQNPIKGAKIVTIFDEITDEELSTLIQNYLGDEKFDNIYIPLCFGETLSDFNGLRLATHIRCTPSPNQLSNIFIYSFVGIDYLFEHKYFNILKSKNVRFVGFKKKAFQEAQQQVKTPLSFEELPKEVAKLKLDPPKNYTDNHSITNEWAIFRWAKTLNTSDEDIEKIMAKVNNQLYFKYLKTIYPVQTINRISNQELQLNVSNPLKVLLIDDEAEKGWSEIFCTIIERNNNLEFSHLCDQISTKSSDEIVEFSLDIIKNEDIDIVLLDFRLHPDDFGNNQINDITGLKVLREIKLFNPGIQVIMVSATNKIWNLQALQDEGADGFIMKESLIFSGQNNTHELIKSFVNQLNICLKKSFLKKIFNQLIPLVNHLNILVNLSPKSHAKKDFILPQGKMHEYLNLILGSKTLLLSKTDDLSYTYLQLILIIEDVVKTLYRDDHNQNHVVEFPSFSTKTVLERKDEHVRLHLTPSLRWNNFVDGCYDIDNSDADFQHLNKPADRVLFNYRLFCVLHFRYNIKLDEISRFSGLYHKRSKLAHSGNNNNIRSEDILTALELISSFTELDKT